MRMVALCQVIILAAVLGCTALAARAQTRPGPAGTAAATPNQAPQGQGAGEAGAPVAIPRFSLQRVDGGYLRLDAENGSVAFCAPRNPRWNCQSVSDNRTGAEKEVVCTPRGDPEWNCQELNVDRAALEKEIARLQDEVTSLKQKLDRGQEEVTSLKQEFAGRSEVASLKQEVDRRQGEVTALKQEFDRRQNEVASLKQKVDRQQDELTSLKQEIDRRQETVASLKQEVARRQEEITSLKREVNLRQEEISSLKQQADRRREEVTLLKEEITALRAPPAPPAPPPPADNSSEFTITLPSRDDIARAGTYLQDTAKEAWQRLVDIIAHFQRDVMRKS